MPIDVTRVLTKIEGASYRTEPLLSAAQADAILEIAYLSAAANRDWSEEEARNFRALIAPVTALTGAEASPPSPEALRTQLDRFDAALEHSTAEERTETLAAVLASEELRALAYKVAFAMSICDLATGDDESDFLDALAVALAIDARVDELTAEVYAALDDSEPDGEPA